MGLPWPTKITGIRSDFLREANSSSAAASAKVNMLNPVREKKTKSSHAWMAQGPVKSGQAKKSRRAPRKKPLMRISFCFFLRGIFLYTISGKK
ncbi:MAG: hypothetical protein ACWA6Y_12315 [Polaromonas sp.]